MKHTYFDRQVLPSLFFLSGASSLILETIFSRLLSYTFGNTAQAVSTVLAAFLGGLALGAFLIGRWTDRRSPSIRLYGLLEIGVALYALLIPELFSLLTSAYVAFCQHFVLGDSGLTAVRFGMAALGVLPASFLMGGTLPVVSRYVASRDPEFEKRVDALYGWNTLGAALGALFAAYLFIPVLGIRGAIYLACATNLLICVSTFLLPQSQRSPAESEVVGGETRKTPIAPRTLPSLSSNLILLGAFLTGAAALGYEVLWTHIQAFTIGNTVYAFGVTLFVILCGLGLGAQIVARMPADPERWGRVLAASQLCLALVVFLTLPLWGYLSPLFAHGLRGVLRFDSLGLAVLGFGLLGWSWWRLPGRQRPEGNPQRTVLILLGGALAVGLVLCLQNQELIALNWVLHLRTNALFVSGELMRFLCAFFLLIVPAILLGVSFPLLVNLYSASAKQAGERMGRIYASNTLGAILGALITGFFLIPRLGSQGTLRNLATANAALALLFASSLIPARTRRVAVWATAAAALVVAGWFGIGSWDPRKVCDGTYIYFSPSIKVDRVLYLKEDNAGGMTSVVEANGTRTLLSNGKFQGNNATEQGAQVRFALLPMLFTHDVDKGLVIGLGTGQTLNTLALFPFRHIDVAEMAPQIIEAARGWFGEVNGGVLDRDPRVHVSVADGRNFLLLSQQRYDVITVEVSSIWIDGEADLYNHEFYELCKRRLAQGGVLQQWVQLHHMPTKNLLVLLNTVARVFPHVAFFASRGQAVQGLLVASMQPLTADYTRLRELDKDPGIRAALRSIHTPTMESLLGDLLLYGDSMHRTLASLPQMGLPLDFTSTDFSPYLEYQTPKGNVYPRSTIPMNLRFLQEAGGSLSRGDLPIGNVPSQDDWNLLMGYVLAERNETQAAFEAFSKVNGAGKMQAQEEISRIQTTAAPQTP